MYVFLTDAPARNLISVNDLLIYSHAAVALQRRFINTAAKVALLSTAGVYAKEKDHLLRRQQGGGSFYLPASCGAIDSASVECGHPGERISIGGCAI